METGQLEVLNCGEGDLKIVVDEKDPASLERAKRIIQDMLKRGYALFVHGPDNTLVRVKRFDPKAGTYVIGDGPLYAGDKEREQNIKTPEAKRERHVPIVKAKATVVGRSAGG